MVFGVMFGEEKVDGYVYVVQAFHPRGNNVQANSTQGMGRSVSILCDEATPAKAWRRQGRGLSCCCFFPYSFVEVLMHEL